MSAVIMFRKCECCHRRYAYNPSIGKNGGICPKCHKTQSEIAFVTDNKRKNEKKNIL